MPDSHYPFVAPQRSALLTTIKKVTGAYLLHSMVLSIQWISSTHLQCCMSAILLITDCDIKSVFGIIMYFLHPLYQVLTEQIAASMTALLDKISSHQFRISQRLQWAAGANPALNSIVDEFERCMNRRKQILQVNMWFPIVYLSLDNSVGEIINCSCNG